MPDMRTEKQKKIDVIVLERVKRGIALLKERYGPGWVDKIDMRSLDLRDGTACVLGQIYGSYCSGQDVLGIDDIKAETFGFYVNDEERYDYAELDEVWQRELTKLIAP